MYKFWLILFLSTITVLEKVYSICGGEYCPVRVKKNEHIQYAQTNFYEGFGINNQYRTVAFDIGGKGYYNALIVQPMYFHPRFSLGAMLPVVQLYRPGIREAQYGLSNPLFLGEFYALNEKTMLAIGSMVELPLGDHEKGIAAEHAMLIPYVTLTQAIWKGYVGGQFAYQTTLSGHGDNHSHATLFVNPHEAEELWYRAFFGWRMGSFTPEILFSGRYALNLHYGKDRNFLNIGTIQRYRISQGIELNLNLEIPILSQERELFRLGGGVYVQLFDFFSGSKISQN